MGLNLEQLKDAASDLPLPERAELAQFLVHTLNEQEAADIQTEWLALAERRMAEVRTGKVTGVSAEDVLKSLSGPGP